MPDNLPFTEDLLAAHAPLPDVDNLISQHSSELPYTDDLLDAHAPPPRPGDVDEFGRITPGNVASGEDADAYYSHAISQTGISGFASSAGRILSAIGQGVHDGWGTGQLGIGPETEAALKRAGIFNDVEHGQHDLVRSFNEALLRPAATGLDMAMRSMNSGFMGLLEGTRQAGTEAVSPEFGRGIAGVLESRLIDAGSGIHVEHPAPTPRDAVLDMLRREPQFIERAADLGVIGQTEGGWKGVEPQRQNYGMTGIRPQADLLEPINVEANKAPIPEPTDVHGMARQIAPDTFKQFDALTEQRDTLREQITTAQADLRKQAEAQNPNAAQITDLQQRLDTMTPKMEAKYGADLRSRIDDLSNGFADQMALLTRDTLEISEIRQKMLAVDYQMRDLSPEVSAAYREAEARLPTAAEITPEPTPAEPNHQSLGWGNIEAGLHLPEEVELGQNLADVEGGAEEATKTTETRGITQVSGGAENNNFTLYRGVPKGIDARDTSRTVGSGLFYSQDEQVARQYAGPDGEVIKDDVAFKNRLDAKCPSRKLLNPLNHM